MSEYTWEFPTDVPATPAVTTVAEGDVDHVQEALDRLPTQYTTDTGVTTLLAKLAGPAQAIENTLQDMLVDRAVDTAEGAQLDIIGKLVGQPRNGQDDDVYRRYIRARIKTSRSKGIVEDLIRIATLVIDDLDARIWVDQQGVAAVSIVVQDAGIDEDTAAATISFLRLAIAGGVRVILESSPSPPDETFTFDEEGPGFDDGYARLDMATVSANNDAVVRATVAGPDGNNLTITCVGDASVGTWDYEDTPTGLIFHFDPGTTTVLEFNGAVELSTHFTIDVAGTLANVLDAGDEVGPENLTGGVEAGGDFSDART